jgi:hypothetical protein
MASGSVNGSSSLGLVLLLVVINNHVRVVESSEKTRTRLGGRIGQEEKKQSSREGSKVSQVESSCQSETGFEYVQSSRLSQFSRVKSGGQSEEVWRDWFGVRKKKCKDYECPSLNELEKVLMGRASEPKQFLRPNTGGI